LGISGLLFIWFPVKEKIVWVSAVLLAVAVIGVSGTVIGINIYKDNIFEFPDGDSEINLWEYLPFENNTLTSTLDEPSTLNFTDNLPRLDGATALYPLYAAFVQATYPDGRRYNLANDLEQYAMTFEEYVEERLRIYENYDIADAPEDYNNISPVACSRTGAAFNNLITGKAEIAFLMDVSEEQRRLAEQKGLTLNLTPIGREAFVFLVNSKNKISGLTVEEVRQIYSGEITNWKGVGNGTVRGKIEPYQRPAASGSQTALVKIMGDTQIIAPKETQMYDMMMGLYKAVSDYKNYRNALGYSFRYYISGMFFNSSNSFSKRSISLINSLVRSLLVSPSDRNITVN
jgi:phosphate transport system substrate-binding protein